MCGCGLGSIENGTSAILERPPALGCGRHPLTSLGIRERYQFRKAVLEYIRNLTSSLEMESMMEKVRGGDGPNLYLSPQLVFTPELTDESLNLLTEIEKN